MTTDAPSIGLNRKAKARVRRHASATASRPPLFRRAVLAAFRDMPRGRLELTTPDGVKELFGVPAGAEPDALPGGLASVARIEVVRESFFRRCVLGGDVGFAEAYLDGEWKTPDIAAVLAWFLLNLDEAPTLSGSRKRRATVLNLLRIVNRVAHLLRSNTRATARRNIGDHYDLSNEFFGLFLDPSMMYSAARWSTPDATLEEAQREKNDALCRSLRLRPEDNVLEIGTGWGGWSIHAATHYGCHVKTVTLSRQQYDYAARRVAEAGLSDRIEVELRDYRDIEGRFDKIVSIEMMEAIGHGYLPEFCSVLDRSLKPDGLLALQFITCPDGRYDEFRKGVDFIQKHIFPGSLLLSLNRVNGQLSEKGGFVLNALEDFGPDYARTLRLWHDRFVSRLEEVRALGFNDRFARKWSYYLKYCEAAFAMRNISVVQTLHTRANNLAL